MLYGTGRKSVKESEQESVRDRDRETESTERERGRDKQTERQREQKQRDRDRERQRERYGVQRERDRKRDWETEYTERQRDRDRVQDIMQVVVLNPVRLYLSSSYDMSRRSSLSGKTCNRYLAIMHSCRGSEMDEDKWSIRINQLEQTVEGNRLVTGESENVTFG